MAWSPIHYHWQWQLKSKPAELWPYVADTRRFNQAAALPAIDYSEIPLPLGGSQRIGRTSRWGISVEFEDIPFDWVKEQSFSNVRLFKVGPLAKTVAKLTLLPNAEGTLLQYDIEVTPANLLGVVGIPYQFGWVMRRSFGQAFSQIDAYLQNQAAKPFNLITKPLIRAENVRLNNLVKQLAQQGYAPQWVQHLVDLLSSEADLNLIRLRPYVLADIWQAPRQTILEMFLSAAKLSLLNMRWDVMCPLCRGAKTTALSLDEVRKGVHCPTCNIDFEADFTKNVELTFTPHPQIRTVDDFEYCIGGPMITPHILAHQTLSPGEIRSFQLQTKAHGFRLRTQQPGVEAWFSLPDPTPPDEEVIVELNVWLDEPDSLEVGPVYAKRTTPQSGLTIHLTNHTAHSQQIYVERSNWYTNAVTAAKVTTLQHFRDLFSDEVLRPGEEIGVQGMTILFSDLVGSTAMYNEWGDAPSYAVVREQFAFLQGIVRRHEGAIVKTIGDAIMAAFTNPVDGITAALAIQKEVELFNAERSTKPLSLKLGLYHGACIAVTLNGRLDYFGTTVNLAARLEGQSRGGDVVIPEALLRNPAVAALLDSLPVGQEAFETAIKGFPENFRLCRLSWPSPAPDEAKSSLPRRLEQSL